MRNDAATDLILNGFDFLSEAIASLENKPKYSIINFYAALELFIKARLFHEHWSLIVHKDPDWKSFERGAFVSVGFDTACQRLAKIARAPLSDRAKRSFDKVRRHRNRMVHFFVPEPDRAIPEIVVEQLAAWYELHQLLTKDWSPIFSEYSEKICEIERGLKRHREYLQVSFDVLKPKIARLLEAGVEVSPCRFCGFAAAKHECLVKDLWAAKCLVCGMHSMWLLYDCQGCGKRFPLDDGGHFVCPNCKREDDESALVDHLNDFVVTKDNYFEAPVPANCSECDGYHTVIEYGGDSCYMCIRCFTVTEKLEACEWCNEFNNGDLEDSYLDGCSACDGRVGWTDD